MRRTPVADQDNKHDIIEHVNLHHAKEVAYIIKTYTDFTTATNATVKDIYEEGVSIHITTPEHGSDAHFIAFDIEGSPEEKLLYLAYTAMAKQGINLTNTKKRFFEVIATQAVTENFLRITIQSQTPLPVEAPGYCYGFALSTTSKIPKATNPKKPSRLTPLITRCYLWLMKHVSVQRRQSAMEKMRKDIRYYTLQCSWKSSDESFNDMGYIDVFTHGNSPGSTWAQSLKPGDIISSRSELADLYDNTESGKNILIADESAYPALSGLLQQWHNNIAPDVIIVSTNVRDQEYFSTDDLKAAAHVTRITCPAEQQAEHIIAALAKNDTFTSAWGAFEKDAAKNVRKYLRNERSIAGENNRLQGYWRLCN